MRQIVQHIAMRTGPRTIAPPIDAYSESPSASGKTTAKQIFRSGKALQRGIVLFSVLIVITMSILVVAVIAAQRKSDLERARFDSANLSAVFEDQVRQVINTISGAIDRLKGEIESKNFETAFRDWTRLADFNSLPVHITIISAEGKILSSSADPEAKAIDLSDREYFRVHVGNRHGGLFIGKPVLSRLSGKQVIPLSSRLERNDGKFEGVLVANLDADFLAGLYRSVDLGRTGSLMLLGTDGVVRAYVNVMRKNDPLMAQIVGLSRPNVPALREAQFDTEGAYERASVIDDVERIFHWRKVRGYPLIVTAGLGRSEALLVSHSQEILVLAVGGVALFLAFFMPPLLYREISKRIAHEISLNNEKVKLKLANDALAIERKNLRAINEELIKEKRRAEEASNAKSIFLMNMSHEFRTPMHAILNYTNLGLKKLAVEDRDRIEKYMKNTRAAGLRLLGMLNGLLDLAKLEAGKIELQIIAGNLLDVVKETEFELSSLLDEKNLRVDIDVKSQSTAAMFDPGRMVQILVNLFSNAIKFSPAGGCITVVLSDALLPGKRPGLQCSVSDEGVGIPEDELGTIFDRFTQSSATKKAGGGSGLGLTICRELIDLHHGMIWAENGPAGGAVICFVVPAPLASEQTAIGPPSAYSETAAWRLS